MRSDESAEAAALLEPFAATESDTVFLETFGDALIRGGNLDRAREILEKLLREKNAGTERLFELADAYAASAQTTKGVDVLQTLKRRMFADKRQNDFATQLDAVAAKHPHSQGMMEFWAAVYNELNRESQYFEILVKLFDVYFNAGDFRKACDSLERLVDIDAYDYRNQERMEKLRGHVDEAFLKRVGGRLAKSMNTAPPPPAHTGVGAGGRTSSSKHGRRTARASARGLDRADGDFLAVFTADEGAGTAAKNRRDVSRGRSAERTIAKFVSDGELVAPRRVETEAGTGCGFCTLSASGRGPGR